MQTNKARGGSVGPLEVRPHGNLRSGENVFPRDTYLVPHSVSGFRDITVGQMGYLLSWRFQSNVCVLWWEAYNEQVNKYNSRA